MAITIDTPLRPHHFTVRELVERLLDYTFHNHALAPGATVQDFDPELVMNAMEDLEHDEDIGELASAVNRGSLRPEDLSAYGWREALDVLALYDSKLAIPASTPQMAVTRLFCALGGACLAYEFLVHRPVVRNPLVKPLYDAHWEERYAARCERMGIPNDGCPPPSFEVEESESELDSDLCLTSTLLEFLESESCVLGKLFELRQPDKPIFLWKLVAIDLASRTATISIQYPGVLEGWLPDVEVPLWRIVKIARDSFPV
ncbi:hypothetical protein CYLTODRAFT_409153 [Cylindrobasidium torrendii FP15055 ss-10]|uniref:Uncharacterized protein n=1 Tax=Cylindrobasidium torrendii FP15055 ss-10 TaxID=1314674 RepID=A0A0D7BHS1_9AGAR|nr:hypothetical protein CYLTODRAFT_409153 [Cylindrobasidium torrendii FP15055 ss-10]